MTIPTTPAADAPDWAAIVIIILSITAFAIAQGLTFPLISLTLQAKGIAGSLIGLNSAAYAVGAILAVLAIDKLTARSRGDHLIVGALFGCSFCLAAFALTDYIPVWFAARFAIGFCASVISILTGAWLNTASPDRIRGRISGLYGGGMCAGFAAGPLVIPFVGTKDGFGFALVAIYVALIGIAGMVVNGNTRTLPTRAPTGALVHFVRAAPLLVLMMLAFGFADIAAISSMAVYFVRVGYSEAFAAYAITVAEVSTALALPLIGWLLDRASRSWIVFGCSFLGSIAFLTIPYLQLEAAVVVVFAFIGAATFALSTCALTLLGERFDGGMLVAGTASFSLAYATGSIMGSTGTGLAMDLISPIAVPVSVGLFLLGFAIIVAFKSP